MIFLMNLLKMMKNEIQHVPAWIYILLTLWFILKLLKFELASYLPSAFFPLVWILIYIISRIKISRKNEKGEDE